MNINKILKILKINKNCDLIINNIVTCSKEVCKNDLFIAINKGHDYIEEAIKKGASCVIVENNKLYDCFTINVKSTIKALESIATYIRMQYNGHLIAITGSSGKTTTKELISDILKTKYKILKSEENKNNNIGLSNTLLKLNNSYDVAVLELGMNHTGEISNLSQICKPTCSIITNIGVSHIGLLGSVKKIILAKLEILDGMKEKKLIVGDNKYLKKIKLANKVNIKSLNVKNTIYNFDNTEFDIDDIHFIFNVPGASILNDLLIAIKVGLLFNIDLYDMSIVIKNFKNLKGRLNIIYDKYTLIDDSYNSSYESLINGLSIIKNDSRYKIIVLADMLELGKFSKKYHKKINQYLNKITNKEVLLIGEYTKYISGKHFSNINQINQYLNNNIKYNDLIYIKGSRKMNLDKIKILI